MEGIELVDSNDISGLGEARLASLTATHCEELQGHAKSRNPGWWDSWSGLPAYQRIW